MAVRYLAWLCLCLILWPSFAVSADTPPPTGALPVVTNVSGAVVVRSNGVSRDVLSTRIVHPGDTLVTGVDSLATVSLADVGSIRLGPGTTATASSTASNLSLNLASGSVCAQAQATGVTVQAGAMTLSAGDSTAIFSLIRDADSTTIAVYQGRLSIAQSGKAATTLHGGDAAVSTHGGAPSQVPIESVQPQFAVLHCPDEAVVSKAVPTPAPSPAAGGHGGGGAFLGILAGLGVIAALAGGHGGGGSGNSSPPPTSPPGPGVLSLSASSLTFPVDGAAQTFTVTEANYGGPINATSGDTGIATVSPATGPSGVVFTVTPVGTGSTKITVTDNHGGLQTVNVTVSPSGALIVSTPSLSFTTGAAAQPFTASESSYAGKISAASGNAAVATVSPASGLGPGPVTFTVTPTGGGSTTITVTDDHGGSQTVAITVAGPLGVSPGSLSFLGTTTAQTFTATDPLYLGTISASIDRPAVASVTPVGSSSGPSAKFKVTPLSAGSATITVSDTLGASTTVTVTVSTGKLAVNPPSLTFTVGGASQSFNASEADYTGLISAASSNTGRATVSPASGSGPSFDFNVTPTAPSGIDTTIGVTDDHGGLVFVNVTITGPLSPSPASLDFAGTTAAQPVGVADPNYFGSISALSTNTTVATVTSPSTGPSGSFSVTPVNRGSTTINFSDANGGAASVNVTVESGPLNVSTSSVLLAGVSSSAPFTASETNYTGLISASTDNAAVATVSPASAAGPGPVPFTITAAGSGTTTIHVSDDHGGAQAISVTVLAPPSVAPSSLTFGDVGAPNAQTVTVNEPGYSGPFSFTSDTCTGSGIVSLSSAGSGPSSTVTVTALSTIGGGTCSFSVEDTTHSLTSPPVSVTVGPFGAIVPSPATLTFTDVSATQSFGVSESGYSGTFTVDQSACTGSNVASVSPLSGTSATSFTVTASNTNPAGGSCDLSITDDHGSTVASVAITVGPFGTLTLTPPSLSLSSGDGGKKGNFSVSETGYTGLFTVDDSACSSADVATVDTHSGDSTTTFKVTASGTAANCAMLVSDDHGSGAREFILVTAGNISVSPGQTIQFAAGSPASQIITVFDFAASTYNATSSDLTGDIASVSPSTQFGPGAVNFTISTQGTAGQASITITDDVGGQAVVSVGVGMSPLAKRRKPIGIHKAVPVASASPSPRPHAHRPILLPGTGQHGIGIRHDGADAPPVSTATPTPLPPRPSSGPIPSPTPAPRPSAAPTRGPSYGQLVISAATVTLITNGPSQVVTISETGYVGRFIASSSNPGVVRLGASSVNGPSATLLIAPLGAGVATLRIVDDHGGMRAIAVVVRARDQRAGRIPASPGAP